MTMYVRFVQCSDFGMYSVPGARTVESKRYRAVGQHGEIAAEQRKCGAFFDPSRQDTNALQTVFRGQTDIVGARVARLLFNAEVRARSSEIFNGLPEDHYVSGFLDPYVFAGAATLSTVIDRVPASRGQLVR